MSKILTWNMQGGGLVNPKIDPSADGLTKWELVFNYAEDEEIDYICLQECSNSENLDIKKKTSYDEGLTKGFVEQDDNTYFIAHYAFSRSGDTAGRCSFAILIETKEGDLESFDVNLISSEGDGLRPLIAIKAKGIEYTICNFHAPSAHDNFARKILLQNLIPLVKDPKFIIGGDFNVDIDDIADDEGSKRSKSALEFFSEEGITMYGSGEFTHEKRMTETDHYTEELDTAKSKEYDYFLCKGIGMDNVNLADIKSDHLAVQGEIKAS